MIDKRIVELIESKLPFAAVSLPDTDTSLIFTGYPVMVTAAEAQKMTESKRWYAVKEFSIDPGKEILFLPDEEAKGQGNIPIPPTPLPYSGLVDTEQEAYFAQAQEIIDTLKLQGGKTVLSRIISIGSGRNLSEILSEYFSRFPHTLRYVYNFPQTSLWFGATPELLLHYDLDTKEIRTMSLAGTRRYGDTNEWDHKNKDEHRYVTDYLMQTLKSMGLEPHIYDSSDMRYGDITHLCDRIRAHGDIHVIDVLNSLSPTPAVCGWPKEEAYRQITAIERHQRHCYGGWMAFRDGNHIYAYVCLRCASVMSAAHGYIYNLYVGGGLTAQSIADDEWRETEAKAEALINIIRG